MKTWFPAVLAVLLSARIAPAADRVPAERWARADRPESLGYSAERLRAAREWSREIGSAAVMIVVDGLVLDEWGDTSRRYHAHSIRKSLLTSMYGALLAEGRLRRDATLSALGIDDDEPLTADERKATLADLLRSRSGVYLPALALDGALDLPPRGSRAPGSYFHYNNWDFNVLGTVFRSAAGEAIGAAFARRIASPLQMEDFRTEDWTLEGRSHDDNAFTRHPSYPLRISTRDLARFGLLYMNRGRWRERQVVPAEWVDECLEPFSVVGEHERFGHANWTVYLEGKVLPGGVSVPGRVVHTSGVNVHRLFMVPQLRMVVVHRVDTDGQTRRPPPADVDRLLGAIIAARIDAPAKPAAAPTTDATGLDVRGHTPLLVAVGRGNLDAVRTLLAKGTSGDDRSPHDGQTALMWAAAQGGLPIAEALIAAGADPRAKAAITEHTGLMLASARGDTAMVKMLLAAGADPRAKASNGVSALLLAHALEHAEVEQLLTAAGAEADGSALLPPAAYVPEWIAHLAGWKRLRGIDEVRALVTRSAVAASTGENELLAAAARGDLASVSRLLQGKAKVDPRTATAWTPLIVAASYGHDAVVDALLRNGAAPDRTDPRQGQTPLIWAAQNGRARVVILLLKGGANVNARDAFGSTALAQAVRWRRHDIVKALLAARADPGIADQEGRTALFEAMEESHLDTIRALIAAGADVNARDRNGHTPLMAAQAANRLELVSLLVQAGADPNGRE